jgi:hypothetical protein
MKKEVIKIGDRIKITNPTIVTKVGYDYGYDEAKWEINSNHGDEINRLIGKVSKGVYIDFESNIFVETVYNKIVHCLVPLLTRGTKRQSSDRKLFTEESNEYQDYVALVAEKKVVKTGTYHPYYRSYDGEVSPPELVNVKTHVLLGFYFNDGKLKRSFDIIWIEQKNVEKLGN